MELRSELGLSAGAEIRASGPTPFQNFDLLDTDRQQTACTTKNRLRAGPRQAMTPRLRQVAQQT